MNTTITISGIRLTSTMQKALLSPSAAVAFQKGKVSKRTMDALSAAGLWVYLTAQDIEFDMTCAADASFGCDDGDEPGYWETTKGARVTAQLKKALAV